jgi:hypothetical protein
VAHPCLATPRRRRPSHERPPWLATITLDAGAAIELAHIHDFLAEWIAQDDDAFAGHGYTTNELNAAPQFTLDTT